MIDKAIIAKHALENCRTTSNFYFNVVFCKNGKYLLFDTQDSNLVSAFQLSPEEFRTIYNGKSAFLITPNVLDTSQLYMQAGTKVYSMKIAKDFKPGAATFYTGNAEITAAKLGANKNHEISLVGDIDTDRVFKPENTADRIKTVITRDELFGELKNFQILGKLQNYGIMHFGYGRILLFSYNPTTKELETLFAE